MFWVQMHVSRTVCQMRYGSSWHTALFCEREFIEAECSRREGGFECSLCHEKDRTTGNFTNLGFGDLELALWRPVQIFEDTLFLLSRKLSTRKVYLQNLRVFSGHPEAQLIEIEHLWEVLDFEISCLEEQTISCFGEFSQNRLFLPSNMGSDFCSLKNYRSEKLILKF